MKMRILLLATAVAAATACTRNVEPRFALLQIDTLIGTPPVQIKVNYRFSSIENAAESPALAAIQHSDIARFFGLEHFEGTLSEAVDRSLQRFADECLPESGADAPPSATAGYWYATVVSDSEQLDSLLTFTIRREGYIGGAHGYASTEYYTYRLADSRLLELADLFGADVCETLRGRLESKLVEMCAGDSAGAEYESPRQVLEAAGFFPELIDLTENFRILPDGGVLLHYNPYQIACYATGPVEVVFSGEEIATLRQP